MLSQVLFKSKSGKGYVKYFHPIANGYSFNIVYTDNIQEAYLYEARFMTVGKDGEEQWLSNRLRLWAERTGEEFEIYYATITKGEKFNAGNSI